MLLMSMGIMSGCSLLPTKIVYVKPEKVSFVVPEINVTETPIFKPTDINVSQDKLHIITTVDTFLTIQSITKKLRLEKAMFKSGYESLKRQILNYRKKVNHAKQ